MNLRLRVCAALLMLADGVLADGVFAGARAPLAAATQDVPALVRSGDYARALELADAQPDALVRARSQLHVRYHAGDMSGGLQAGLAGLRGAPDDLELLSGVVELCAALHLAEPAREHLARLEAALAAAQLAPADREWWNARAADLRARAEDLRALHARRDAAAQRARWTAGLMLAAMLGAMSWLVAGRQSPRA